jgi:hypothetical protein
MTEPRIEAAPDSPPVVLGVAARLRRAAADPGLARRMSRMKGVLALKSSVDAQAATIRFDRGRVALEPGVAADAGLVITLNFDHGSAKPKVKGAARHPLFGLAAAKVLDPPAKPWQDEAAAFWAFAQNMPRVPRSLLAVCTDDGTQVQFGEAGEPEYQIHGSAAALQSAFSGSSIFLQDVLEGKVLVVGSLEHASVLTGCSIAWAMGGGNP